mgnify:CR=1 FL=1
MSADLTMWRCSRALLRCFSHWRCALNNDNEHEKCIKNFLHVPTITKNLVIVRQMVVQGMQVLFNSHLVSLKASRIKFDWLLSKEEKDRCSSLIKTK